MLKLEEAKSSLAELEEKVIELGDSMHVEDMRAEVAELEKQTQVENFWADAEKSSKLLQNIKNIKEKVTAFDELKSRVEETIMLCEMAIEEGEESELDAIESELEELIEEEKNMRLELLLSGEYDSHNAILSFHPGAGGTEAQDWALMLYRMYTRYGENHKYKVQMLDWLDGDEAGLKSATLRIAGKNAYGYLKGENGVHRLVRVSPFDSSGRRHTSFASVEVMPEFDDDDMKFEIRPEDIEVSAHRSSGAGGQHVNKTDSAIRIVHLPTGIVVGCQSERSQLQNKETAMKMLKSKLMEIKEREKLDKIEDIQGTKSNIEWGSQIRSYVFMPYTLVKDNRTGYEDGDVQSVMDGNIDGFITAYLKLEAGKKLDGNINNIQ
ncbi:MAG: peptide chain release factor 2 [Clostridiales bacterium]|nr:peptide chain release factor 2 [Clostridiales bacterium]